MNVPEQPKIYHIAHVDRLPYIVTDEHFWCDREIARRSPTGTTIGLSKIKERRLNRLTLSSHPGLFVGDCVPFYFCPRSVMLYIIYQANHEDLEYRGGQGPIVHFEADVYRVVDWANRQNKRWAFTLSNAGSNYFEDRRNLDQLNEIDWDAVHSDKWQNRKEGKQAEFLLEFSFPWELVERIGVHSQNIYNLVVNALPRTGHRPRVEIRREWYYP